MQPSVQDLTHGSSPLSRNRHAAFSQLCHPCALSSSQIYEKLMRFLPAVALSSISTDPAPSRRSRSGPLFRTCFTPLPMAATASTLSHPSIPHPETYWQPTRPICLRESALLSTRFATGS